MKKDDQNSHSKHEISIPFNVSSMPFSFQRVDESISVTNLKEMVSRFILESIHVAVYRFNLIGSHFLNG